MFWIINKPNILTQLLWLKPIAARSVLPGRLMPLTCFATTSLPLTSRRMPSQTSQDQLARMGRPTGFPLVKDVTMQPWSCSLLTLPSAGAPEATGRDLASRVTQRQDPCPPGSRRWWMRRWLWGRADLHCAWQNSLGAVRADYPPRGRVQPPSPPQDAIITRSTAEESLWAKHPQQWEDKPRGAGALWDGCLQWGLSKINVL